MGIIDWLQNLAATQTVFTHMLAAFIVAPLTLAIDNAISGTDFRKQREVSFGEWSNVRRIEATNKELPGRIWADDLQRVYVKSVEALRNALRSGARDRASAGEDFAYSSKKNYRMSLNAARKVANMGVLRSLLPRNREFMMKKAGFMQK